MKAFLASLKEMSFYSFQKLSATHCCAIKCGYISDVYVSNRILDSCIKLSFLSHARNLFDEMSHRDSVSWNTMISGYTSCGELNSAWCLFLGVKRFGCGVDGYSFSRLLKGIASGKRLDLGQQLQSLVIKGGYECNVYVGSSLVDMYAKCERVEEAFQAFQEISERNSVSWNALIAGFVQVRDIETAFWLLGSMEMEGDVTLDDGTFAPLLTLLDDPMFYNLSKEVHAKVFKLGLEHKITICNAMINAYVDCGSVSDAKRVFDGLGDSRDLISWNSMIAGFSKHELKESAFELFIELQKTWIETDVYTYTSILSACSGEEDDEIFGKSLHGLVIKKGLEQVTSVSNALISMYIQFPAGSMKDALSLFESLKSKDLVSWNSVMTGFSQKGHSEDALKFFGYLRSSNIQVDDYAFSAVLRSCSDLATLQLGQQVHALATKSSLASNEFVTSSLILMYSRCGVIENARKCFEQISSKHSTIAWNAMILGYAQHGSGQVSLDLFSQMCKQNVKLDHVTFTAILTACSHTGLVQKGLELLHSMESLHKIPPRMEHYAAAVDLLSRAGLVNKAKELIESMPMNPDPMVLKTFLGACRSCGEIEMATKVANHLLEIEPEDHFTYVSLSHMYSDLKKWKEKADVKKMMKERGVKKVPGWSWIEVSNRVYAFNAEDRSHPLCQEIYLMIKDLTREMQWFDSDCNNIDLRNKTLVLSVDK